MKKKQLLATLVMLSLMQGSVYAGETITQKDFEENNTYTVKENPAGSVEITSSKGDYTLKPAQNGSPIVFTPTRSDGAAIFINSKNATTDLSSLTISSGVQITGTETASLKTTDALIKVGASTTYLDKGGKLTIEGDLLIDNVLSDNSIISVIQGAVDTKTGTTIASSFAGGNITIQNSQAVSKSSNKNDSALIYIKGYRNSKYGNQNASFTAGDVNLINSSANRAIYMDTATTKLSKVYFEGGSYNYGLDTTDQKDRSNVTFEADSIIAKGTGFKTAFVRMYNDESFNVKGKIFYDGTGVNNVDDLTDGGDNHFINFTNTNKVSVGGDVTVQTLSWNDNVLYVSNASTATFGNITINNITQNETSASNGVRVKDVKTKFTADDIKVTNMKFLQGNNSQYGVFFWNNESAYVESIVVDGITFKGLDKVYSKADGNGGVSINSTNFYNTLDGVDIRNIVQKSSNNNQTYYGIKLSNSKLAAECFCIDNVTTNAFDGTAIGLYNAGDMQYKSINISNIKGGTPSSPAGIGNAGLYLTTGKSLTALDTADQPTIINIDTIEGIGDTYGVYNGAGSNGDLSGDILNVRNVTSSEAESYGAYLNGKTNFDSIYVENIEGANKAYGILNKGRTNDNFSVSDDTVVSGIKGNDTAVAIAVESGKADFAAVNISDVSASDNGRIALISAKDGADISIGSGLITHESFDDSYIPSYKGNYNDNADGETNKINSIALRSVGGSKITLGSNTSTLAGDDNTSANGVFTIVGDIVAGRGAQRGKAGSIEINGKAGTKIHGDVYAGNDGTVNITLDGNGSILEGQVDDYHELDGNKAGEIFRNSDFYDDNGNCVYVKKAGEAKLNINDGAKWIARGRSFVDTVTLNDGTIDMSKNENSSVTVNDLSGNGTVKMRLNTGERDQSDMLYVTGSLEGNYELQIAGDEFDINEITEDNPLRFATVKGDVNTENLKARAVDAGFFNNEYTITKENFAVGDDENVIYNNSGVEAGGDHAADYKPGNDYIESTFDAADTNLLIGGVSSQTVSDAGKTIINMSRANYSNAIYMDRLNKRMGETRYINHEEEQGMWVRLRHDRIGKTDAFRSQNTMYEMGYDVKQDCGNGERRIGMAIDYMDGKTEYRNVAGDGDIKRYGLWVYDTWTSNKGHYTDFVAKWGHLENDFEIYNSRGKVNGDYSNNVFSVSAEYGKKNDMGSGWYFEPQAQLQLARVTGADYVTSQNTKVSLDGINSLIGRAGFRIGRDMDENSTVYLKADLLHEFLGDQTITALDGTINGAYRETFENDGTWYDVGFGFAAKMSKNSYAYMDFEKSFGNDNEETYQINAGMQWSF